MAISSLRSRRRLPEIERVNAALAADAGDRAAEDPLPPVALISLTDLLRRRVPTLIVSGLLYAVFITLIDGRALTLGRVLGTWVGWTVLMTLLIVWQAWRRPRSEPPVARHSEG